MAKVSVTYKQDRRKEIIEACKELYRTMGFRAITLKDISEATSFSRPSIYNYFKTKEEIFLGILTEEYDSWKKDLEEIIASHTSLTKEALADCIAKTLVQRETLLKISAMNLYEIEENSSIEQLQEYKIAFRSAQNAVYGCIDKFLSEEAEEKKPLMQYAFFPFMYGIYPYTNLTEKQKEAMNNVQITYQSKDIYEITNMFLLQVLK